MLKMTFHDKRESFDITTEKEKGEWLQTILLKIAATNDKKYTFTEVKSDYETSGLEDFELFWYSKPIHTLQDFGLLVL